MKTGDILLVNHKFDPVGWLIRIVTGGKFHHVAWIINDFVALEVGARGVNFGYISRFKNKMFFEYKVLRIPNLTKSDFHIAMSFAYDNMRKHSLLDYLLIALSMKFRFQPKGLYTCSGLVATALSKIGWYFDKNKIPYFITPVDIEKTKELINVTEEFKNMYISSIL